MSAPATTSAVKPVLRGLHNAYVKQTFVGCAVLVAVVGVAFKYMYQEPRKKAYAEFYKKYDAQKSFEKMKDAGLLQSC